MTTGKKAQKNTRAYEKRNASARKSDIERGKIEMALKKGTMKTPAKCPRCGRKPPEVRIEYDHDSPKGWSCSKCNKRGGAVGTPRNAKKKR